MGDFANSLRLSKMAALPRTYSKFLRNFSTSTVARMSAEGHGGGWAFWKKAFFLRSYPCDGAGTRQRIWSCRARGEARVQALRPHVHQIKEIPLGRWQQVPVPQPPRERPPLRLRGRALNCPSAPSGVMTFSPNR